MRLINIYTRKLEEFYDTARPKYFILSHRWEADEITYKDFIKGRGAACRGYRKVEELCAFARLQNENDALKETFGGSAVEWVWVDTCK